MEYLADLHIHSPYSRATSKASNLAGLFAWAQVKGIHLIGTGDFTHPGWFQELKENLTPAEPGLFRLKDQNVPPALHQAHPAGIDVRFILSSEISSIYKRHDKVRKVHNILFAPDFASVERINKRLAAIGNIESDGRPILGLDSRNLLEIQLDEIPEGFLVPAHIWTPWFSLFGSKSGFDSIEECYGDLTEHIFALETGLSSDPDMNRLISALDRYTLISNSDCHSPSKLGREVNIFNCDFNFYSLKEALKNPAKGFAGTVEFFPEEGKYHIDGHRKCNVSMEPWETRRHNNICPVCNKPLTVGVSHRVLDLADREKPFYPENSPKFKSLIPLQEVIGEIMGRGPATKGVLAQYAKAISRFGSEFNLFLHTPVDDINHFSPLLSEAIKRIRENRVIRQAGFDGEFGVIHVFEEGEIKSLSGQARLFTETTPRKIIKIAESPIKKHQQPAQKIQADSKQNFVTNKDQQQAIESSSARIIVSAGPGTGKTFTLVSRLVHLLEKRKIDPAAIAAITFTNRAADEMGERLQKMAGEKSKKIFVGTFHKFCLNWLQSEETTLSVVGEQEREIVLKRIFPQKTSHERKKISKELTDHFLYHFTEENSLATSYQNELTKNRSIDLEAVIPFFVYKLKTDTTLKAKITSQVNYLFVDEFQDVNRSQYDLVELLGQSAEIFAIGDPNQAIYGFRGSDLNFFFKFMESENTESVSLGKNYRSAPFIVNASTALISHNTKKSRAFPSAEKDITGSITLQTNSSALAEAEHVVRVIEKTLGGISSFSINTGRSTGEENSYSFKDVAVLYRMGRQSYPLAKALERRGIPFQLVGGQPFFMEKNVRALYFWILAAAEQANAADFFSLCRELPGIGKSTVNKLEDHVPIHCHDFFRQTLSLSLPERTIKIVRSCMDNLSIFRQDSKNNLPQSLLPVCDIFKIDPTEDNFRRFAKLAGAFGSLHSFAAHLQENAKASIYDDRAEAVSLMTLHGAKGLEFPVVVICGLDSDTLPCRTAGCDLEEERRLFYVGMTRAKDKLFLSSAGGSLSPFINEIPSSLLNKTKDRNIIHKKKSKQLKLF